MKAFLISIFTAVVTLSFSLSSSAQFAPDGFFVKSGVNIAHLSNVEGPTGNAGFNVSAATGFSYSVLGGVYIEPEVGYTGFGQNDARVHTIDLYANVRHEFRHFDFSISPGIFFVQSAFVDSNNVTDSYANYSAGLAFAVERQFFGPLSASARYRFAYQDLFEDFAGPRVNAFNLSIVYRV